jgi:hypothetical protein
MQHKHGRDNPGFAAKMPFDVAIVTMTRFEVAFAQTLPF